jgi:hypothetical protein
MLLSAMLCVALISGTGWQSAAPNPDDVLKREQQRVDLLTAGKLDEVAAILSPTLTYTHSSGVIDTKERFLQNLRSGQVAYKRLKHGDLQVRFVTPDVAVVNGISDVLISSGGKDQEIPLRFTLVYVRKGGVWLMEAWHSARRTS